MTGNELKQLRVQAGLTQAELAERLGVSGSTVSRWEQNKIPIPSGIEAKLREILQDDPVTEAGEAPGDSVVRRRQPRMTPPVLSRPRKEEIPQSREELIRILARLLAVSNNEAALLFERAIEEGPETMSAHTEAAIVGLAVIANWFPSVDMPPDDELPVYVDVPPDSRIDGHRYPVGVSKDILRERLIYSSYENREDLIEEGVEGPDHQRTALILISRLLLRIFGPRRTAPGREPHAVNKT